MKKFKFLSLITMCLLLVFCSFNVVKASTNDTTVEGETTHFVTGESYAQAVEMTGFNVLNNNFYTNFTLNTTKDVTGVTPTFDYFIDVYKNSDASKIGSEGTYAAPTQIAGTLATPTLDITNKELTLSEDLPLAYRLVITVKTVTTA